MTALRTSLPVLIGRATCLPAMREALHRIALIAVLPTLLSFSAVAGAADQPAAGAVSTSQNAAACDPTARPTFAGDAALWDAQLALIGKCLALVPAPAADRPNIYTVAIAPLGTQTLFSREAKMALQAFAANYGGTASQGLLLSNASADLMKVPLATLDNISRVLREIGGRTERSPDDILIVYLASHGRPDAALASALPGNIPILAVSADSLAAALDQAHIRRRVIIISACFAGSWIPRLANDDTIVLTAARADRTSFGCDDTRPLTYFGEAFLNGPLSRGASLADSFEGAKKTVTQWEQAQKLLFSEPQAYIGRNMEAFWRQPARSAAESSRRPTNIKRGVAEDDRSKIALRQP